MDLRDELQQRLGDGYRVERELDAGGMSRLFLVQDHALSRPLVAKVLASHLLTAESLDRFRQEITLAAGLHHPNIVGLISAGDIDGLPYFLMPYVEGESLRHRLRKTGTVSAREAVTLLRDVARGLGYAHSRGVIHRDVKPDNVLIFRGAAQITDFGVAKALSSARAPTPAGDQRSLTQVGTSLGTPAYMAPEQAAADPSLDHRADLYSLGVMAYEMMAGTTPFEYTSIPKLLAAHLSERPQPLSSRIPGVTAALSAVVMRCLEKDPDDRFLTADDLLVALDDAAVLSGPVAATVRTSNRRWPRATRWTGVVILSVIAVVAGARVLGGRGRAPSPRSIAVLPFTNVGSDSADAYFAQGMTDQMIDLLARTPGLEVVSRTGVYGIHGDQQTAADIGRALHVGMLLEGLVRHDGPRLRVSARLVDSQNGLTLWTQTYERPRSDVFALQDTISAAIATAVRPRVGPAGPPRERRRTDPVAFDSYLRGRFFFSKRGPEAINQALRLFQTAAARDPGFAEAYAGIAEAYGVLPLYGGVTEDSILPLALEAADHAIRLDSSLAAPHAARGNLLAGAWRWAEAEADLRRAVALDSSDATAHQWLGENLLIQGRRDEAVDELRRAADLDPLSPIINASYGVALGAAGHARAGIAAGRLARRLDPSLEVTAYLLGAVYLYDNRVRDAIALLEPLAGVKGAPAIGRGLLGYAYAKGGMPAKAVGVLQSIDSLSPAPGVPSAMARIYLGLGRLDAALDWLDRAADRRDPFFSAESLASPLFDPLRDSPRFHALLHRIGLGAEAHP